MSRETRKLENVIYKFTEFNMNSTLFAFAKRFIVLSLLQLQLMRKVQLDKFSREEYNDSTDTLFCCNGDAVSAIEEEEHILLHEYDLLCLNCNCGSSAPVPAVVKWDPLFHH